MSTNATAKLFYGYMQPKEDREYYNEECDHSEDEETAWSAIAFKEAYCCVGGLCGHDGNLGTFLAVRESLHKATWTEDTPLKPEDFQVRPAWDEMLRKAAKAFGLDLTGLRPGWHLVCLYF
jgi:hypothetical protein